MNSLELGERIKQLRRQYAWGLDQESAVAEELEQLAATPPAAFSPSHVATLIRAIRVQQQLLDFYRLTPVYSSTV